MAHEDCLGTGPKKWTSTFILPEDDGEIEINEVSNTLVGTHHLTGAPLKNIVCDGNNISFSREDPANGEEVFYEEGKIKKVGVKVKINGKFRRVPLAADSDGGYVEKSKKPKANADNGGDWEAEKPIA